MKWSVNVLAPSESWLWAEQGVILLPDIRPAPFLASLALSAFAASLFSFLSIIYNLLKFCLHLCCVPVLKYNYAHSVEGHFPWYQDNESNLDEASHFHLSQLAKLIATETVSFPSPNWWTGWASETAAAPPPHLTHTSPGSLEADVAKCLGCNFFFSPNRLSWVWGEKCSAKERKNINQINNKEIEGGGLGTRLQAAGQLTGTGG